MVDREGLEYDIGDTLRRARQSLATAESCSGGLVAHRLTNVPGSSSYFMGGVVTYSNEAKERLLAVDADILESKGAVSEEVARSMAEGVRRRFNTDYGVGVTGIAGPTGGTAEKPVGLVYIAVATPSETFVERNLFTGSRVEIKEQTAEKALAMLKGSLA